MRAWIRISDAPGCYECEARAERKSTLQGTGLVRTVGACAQRRVALMPRAIATARDAFLHCRRESATRFERPAKQALALATEPRAKQEARSVPISSPVTMFEQIENVAIAHLAGGVWPLQPLPSAHAHGTNGQCFVSMYCLIKDDHAC